MHHKYLVIFYVSHSKFLTTDLDKSPPKKRKGRGITRMNDILARTPNMPKIKITLNKFGQPVGENSRQFSSVLGCQVRKKLSVGCPDWRLVNAEKKYEVWTDLKVFLPFLHLSCCNLALFCCIDLLFHCHSEYCIHYIDLCTDLLHRFMY